MLSAQTGLFVLHCTSWNGYRSSCSSHYPLHKPNRDCGALTTPMTTCSLSRMFLEIFFKPTHRQNGMLLTECVCVVSVASSLSAAADPLGHNWHMSCLTTGPRQWSGEISHLCSYTGHTILLQIQHCFFRKIVARYLPSGSSCSHKPSQALTQHKAKKSPWPASSRMLWSATWP